MRRVANSVTGGALASLVAAALLLTGCPLKDDYSIAQDNAAGGPENGGTAAGGSPDSSGSGRSGASGVSGAGEAASAGSSAAGEGASAGGDNGSGTSGCISLTNQAHEYAFCFSPLSQSRARSNCSNRGMTLAVIEDEAENAWIIQTFSVQYAGDATRSFIGANDVSTEGEWRWADGVTFWRGGAAVSGHYTNWSDEEPNDSSSFTGAADCLSIYFADGTWADVSCEAELPYVCEAR